MLVTRDLVGNEPFAVILADDVIDAEPPALAQMIDVFEEVEGPVIAVERVPERRRLELRRDRRGADPARRLPHPRPRREAAARAGAVRPRDHRPLHPHARHLRGARGDRARRGTGEIQLTNGLKTPAQTRPLYACEVNGVRHDTGNKLGFLKAVVYFALRRPDLAEPFRDYLKTVTPA